MKKEYLKPDVDYVLLMANEGITDEGYVDASTGLETDDDI